MRALWLVAAVAACSGGKGGAPVPPVHPGGDTTAAEGSGSDLPVTARSAAPAPAPAPDAGTPEPGVELAKVTLAEVGLEASSLDRTSDPCIDFYQFACGGWLDAHPIPADRARFARFTEVEEKTRAGLRELLEAAAKGGGDPATKQLGDFYASCMDEGAIERAGLAPIQPVLDRIAKVKNPASWLAAVVALHKLGSYVAFSVQVAPDLTRSTTYVTYLDPGALGLPDRDYYLEPKLADKLAGYRAHVGRMLALGGTPPGKLDAAADDVVAIETALAKLTKTAAAQRDVKAAYNPTDARKLAREVRAINWRAYWKGLGVTPSKKLVLGTPAFFAAFDKLRARFKYPQWANYFRYHLLADHAVALPAAIDDEAFALARLLTGVEQRPERAKRCVEATEHALGQRLGAAYVAAKFPADGKRAATALVDAMVAAMDARLGRLDWMSEPTRRAARAKLAKLVRMIGYPEHPRSYDFVVKRDDFGGNALRAAAFEQRRQVARAGKPVDRGEWLMDAYRVDAYYNPLANAAALPAGILQPPYFGDRRSVAANLGGIGMVIGHELTHAFDDQGARFDADGNLVDWWRPDDATRFAARGQCVADQYATFEVRPKQFINGKLTLGENLADLGGVAIAFDAYRALRAGAAKRYVADGFDEDQQFFVAVAQAWCGAQRPAEAQRRLVGDPHSPPKFRVFGALRNLPEFATAFRCAAGTPMRPAKACQVW